MSAIIIHGGCSTFYSDDIEEQDHLDKQLSSLKRIVSASWEYLSSHSALDTVAYTISLLEDDPIFNAGVGAALNTEKDVELDASIMDGNTLKTGAIAGLKNIRNPILVAKHILENSKHVFFTGEGGQEYAKKHGFKQSDSAEFITEYQLKWWERIKKSEEESQRQAKGTVGVVIMDKKRTIAAGTSTGGLTLKEKGRVGDSPVIGAGTYAHNKYGGVSATGYGEQILRMSLGKHCIDLIRFQHKTAQTAVEESINEMSELKNGKGGLICIDHKGNIGAYTNEKYMPHAYMSHDLQEPVIKMET